MSLKKISQVIKALLVVYLLSLVVSYFLSSSDWEEKILTSRRFITLREMNPKMTYESNVNIPSIRADSEGFIIPSKIHTDPDIEIVFLGGSTTACVIIPDSLRFPYLTGRLLEKETQLKINAYNAGRSGNESIDSYTRLLNVIIPKKPHYVVFMHNINDVINHLYTGSYWSNLNPFRMKVFRLEDLRTDQLPQSYAPPKNVWFPNTQSALQKIADKLTRKTESTDEWESIRDMTIKFDTTLLYQDFESALQAYVHTCIAWNIQPILMTQQNRISMADSSAIFDQIGLQQKLENRVSIVEFQDIYTHANNIIRKVASENELLLIDLDKSVPKKEAYIFDEVHLTSEGSQLVANIISDYLMNHLNFVQPKQGEKHE